MRVLTFEISADWPQNTKKFVLANISYVYYRTLENVDPVPFPHIILVVLAKLALNQIRQKNVPANNCHLNVRPGHIIEMHLECELIQCVYAVENLGVNHFRLMYMYMYVSCYLPFNRRNSTSH